MSSNDLFLWLKQHKDIVFGASYSRYYQSKKMWSLSVIDFEMPNGRTSARFVEYSCIPRLTWKL